MKYRIIVINPFDRGIRKLMVSDRDGDHPLIKEMRRAPPTFKELSDKLRGLRSARFGNYRTVCAVDEKQKSVILASIRPRERASE